MIMPGGLRIAAIVSALLALTSYVEAAAPTRMSARPTKGTWRDVVPSRRKCQNAQTAAATDTTPSALCFERISDIQALHLQQFPGTNRAVVATQQGKMTLITLPPIGTRTPAKVVSTWLDLTPRVDSSQPERGLLSFAFHPQFLFNGRFFVSYICDGKKTPDCMSWCGCNADTGCAVGTNGATCNGQTIVAEYKAAGQNFSQSTSLLPKEVKRYFNFGRPYQNHNGGHIFFGKDGFLYYTSGDGGAWGDPFNMAQQTDTFLGKILRIDVNGPATPGRTYRIPPSNPFVGRKGIAGEIYALGLRNPWRCDQDPVTGTMLCGDVGQDKVEEIDIILPGHNYMWHNYEGNFSYTVGTRFTPGNQMVGAKTAPIFQYLHACDKSRPWIDCVEPGYVAVIAGMVYRALGKNKCLQGKFIYNDVSGPMWVANIFPPAGEKRTSKRVKIRCSKTSPLPCLGGGLPALGSIWAWGKDKNLNAYALGNMGVFRLTSLSRCNIPNC